MTIKYKDGSSFSFSSSATYKVSNKRQINRKKYKGIGRPRKEDYYTGFIMSKGK